MAIPGKVALVKLLSDSSPLSFSDNPTTGDAEHKVYTIDDRDKRYWDRDTSVTVKNNGTVVDSGEYRIQHAGGKVHFYEAQAAEDDITVTGAYVAVSTVAQVSEYSYAINSEIVDVSHFKDSSDPTRGFRDRMVNLVDASGSLSGFHVVNSLLQDYMLDSKTVVLEFDVDQEDEDIDFFACYAVLESNEISPAVEGAVGESVSWQSDGHLLVEDKE